MAALKRTLSLLMILALTAFGAVVAQDAQQNQEQQENQEQEQAQEEETRTKTVEIKGEEVAPLGEIQVGETQRYEEAERATVQIEVETGAVVFTAENPTDQRPNIDLVGPNGFYERFEVESDENGQMVVDGLLPGVYSVAATDEGLQLAHTLVEVTAGQAVNVHIALQDLAAYEEGAFQADDRTTFPDNGFEARDPQPIENAEVGEVTVETDNEDARYVVTGPNGYSQEFTGTFTASDLAPGVYVIAGTLDGTYALEGRLKGAEIATSAVEVNVQQAVTMVPVYDTEGAETEEVEAETQDVQDVAGGGEGQQVETDDVEAEQDAETEQVETEEDVETEEVETEEVETDEAEEEQQEEEEQN